MLYFHDNYQEILNFATYATKSFQWESSHGPRTSTSPNDCYFPPNLRCLDKSLRRDVFVCVCLQLLGFSESTFVSQEQLTERYRQLVRQFHPDKVQSSTADERRRAEQRFIDIQQAYERLSVIKRRRADKTEL